MLMCSCSGECNVIDLIFTGLAFNSKTGFVR